LVPHLQLDHRQSLVSWRRRRDNLNCWDR